MLGARSGPAPGAAAQPDSAVSEGGVGGGASAMPKVLAIILSPVAMR
jgi:hypothetical protein